MRLSGTRTALLWTAAFAAACGGTAARGQAGATSSGSGGAGASISAGPGGAGGSSSGGTGGVSADCAAAIAAIAAVSSSQGSCTAVVRLDYGSLQILGFQLECRSYGQPTEIAARATAQSDTGFGQTGTSLASMPAEEFVFWQAAGDFGGSAAVSRLTGQSVFGGSTVWSGHGDITYPKTWKPAAEIGLGCGQASIPGPQGIGFDLGGGTPLDPATVSAALAAVWSTAVPAGLWQGGYVFDEVVLLYPRTVGAFDPTTAEWVVLVDAGFLE